MSQPKHLRLLAGSAAALATAASVFGGTVDSQMSEDEVRAIVAEMLSDAENRSSLLQSGNAGVDADTNAFFIQSSDGSFNMNVGGQIQFRYMANFSDEEDDDINDGFEPGFQASRTKIHFGGNVYENFEYFVQGAFDFNGGDFNLDDAWAGYNFDNNFDVRMGQFKLPFMREELVPSYNQLAVDRSMTNEIFTGGRSQGVELGYEREDFRTAFAVSDGFNSDDTAFNAFNNMLTLDDDGNVIGGSAFGAGNVNGSEADIAITGRFEWLAMGTWEQFEDFTADYEQDEFAMLLGVAGHWEQSPNNGMTTVTSIDAFGNPVAFTGETETDYFSWTADVSLEGGGWNIYGAAVGAHARSDITGTDPGGTSIDGEFDTDDFGFVVQGGYLIPESDVELFARWDMALLDDDERNIDDDNFNTLTFGGNYYIHGHAAKFTGDVVWFLDDPNPLRPQDTQLGYLGASDDEVVLRLQFQLLF